MSRFSGKQYPGAMRDHRARLREEADERNTKTPESRRRQTRLTAERLDPSTEETKTRRRRRARKEASQTS